MKNTNQLLYQMKIEIANELGITLGAETTSHDNGLVGAAMTRKLVELGKLYLEEQQMNRESIPTYQVSQPNQYNQNQLH